MASSPQPGPKGKSEGSEDPLWDAIFPILSSPQSVVHRSPPDDPPAFQEPPPPPPPEDPDEAALKRAIAIHNEQVKLASTAINNSAVNLITVGVITPIVALGFGLTAAPPSTQITLLSVGGWIVVAYILRSWAHSNLERMR